MEYILYKLRKYSVFLLTLVVIGLFVVHPIMSLNIGDSRQHIYARSNSDFIYKRIDSYNGIGSISTISNLTYELYKYGFRISKKEEKEFTIDIIMKDNNNNIVRMFYDVKDMSIFIVSNGNVQNMIERIINKQ